MMRRILEEMDWIAGMVSYDHVEAIRSGKSRSELRSDTVAAEWESEREMEGAKQRELTLVTAACDRIALSPGVQLAIDVDVRLSARVTWVGRSSMEVQVCCTLLIHHGEGYHWRCERGRAMGWMCAAHSLCHSAAEHGQGVARCDGGLFRDGSSQPRNRCSYGCPSAATGNGRRSKIVGSGCRYDGSGRS